MCDDDQSLRRPALGPRALALLRASGAGSRHPSDGTPVGVSVKRTRRTTLLHELGFRPEHEDAFRAVSQEGHIAGRIAAEHRDMYLAYTDAGEKWAEVSGRFRRRSTEREEFPAIGDWVVLRPRPGDDWATIDEILPRT